MDWLRRLVAAESRQSGSAIVVEDKARDRVPSSDSARERNAVFRPQGPAAARMGYFNGLLRVNRIVHQREALLDHHQHGLTLEEVADQGDVGAVRAQSDRKVLVFFQLPCAADQLLQFLTAVQGGAFADGE